MIDRRLYVNERVDNLQLRQAGFDLTFYGLEAIRRYQQRVDGYNPSLQPIPEPLYIRLALGKQALPSEFKQEWRRAEDELFALLTDIRGIGKPEEVWKRLFQKLQYATELPSKDQALGFLNLSDARLRRLVYIKDKPDTTTLVWTSRVYVENLMLKGALLGSTYFIQPDRPSLN